MSRSSTTQSRYDLLKELGITAIGQRVRILKAVEALDLSDPSPGAVPLWDAEWHLLQTPGKLARDSPCD